MPRGDQGQKPREEIAMYFMDDLPVVMKIREINPQIIFYGKFLVGVWVSEETQLNTYCVLPNLVTYIGAKHGAPKL